MPAHLLMLPLESDAAGTAAVPAIRRAADNFY
jgi:hypothetical protein